MKKVVGLVVLLSAILCVKAQDKFTLSGYIKDSLSGETLIGATVTIIEPGKAVTSNQYGFYSITLPPGQYTAVVSFAGYVPSQLTINLSQNIEYSFPFCHAPLCKR